MCPTSCQVRGRLLSVKIGVLYEVPCVRMRVLYEVGLLQMPYLVAGEGLPAQRQACRSAV